MANRRKYIESHWLVFVFQGIIGLLFGWFVMFTGTSNVSTLVTIVAVTLLLLGIVDAFNLLYRKRRQHAWGLTVVVAVIEIAVSLALLLTINQNYAWHLAIIAIYTICRGVFDILIGLRSLTDPTDRFMYVVCGMCGVILGFVILNSGQFTETTTFIKFFGTYMMIYGLTNLIYGIHNKNELSEQREYKRLLAKQYRLRKKLSAKKSPKKKS